MGTTSSYRANGETRLVAPTWRHEGGKRSCHAGRKSYLGNTNTFGNQASLAANLEGCFGTIAHPTVPGSSPGACYVKDRRLHGPCK